jgi:hypothetical protein
MKMLWAFASMEKGERVMQCLKCKKDMDLYEKDTSSGRDMRTYVCRPCKEYVDVDPDRACCPYDRR